jgi:hypothetical protein
MIMSALQHVAQSEFSTPKFVPAKHDLMACAHSLVPNDSERRAWVATAGPVRLKDTYCEIYTHHETVHCRPSRLMPTTVTFFYIGRRSLIPLPIDNMFEFMTGMPVIRVSFQPSVTRRPSMTVLSA